MVTLIALLDFAAASSYSFVFIHTNMPSQALIAAVGISMFYKIRSRRAMISFFILLLMYWIIFASFGLYKGVPVYVVDIIIFTVFILYTSIMGALLRHYQQSRNETIRLNEQLLHYSKEIEALATTNERNRIARDIHDNVGHSLTSLLIQLQAARKLREVEPERSDSVLMKCELLARSTLQDLRLSVRAMNDEAWISASMEQNIQAFIQDFSDISGMNIQMKVEGSLDSIQPTIMLACFRIIQEAMTNARKHGHAHRLDLTLCNSDGILRITLRDDGVGTDRVEEGFGLRSMRERVEGQLGSIDITSERGQGFTVAIQIPIAQ
ncbi:sensor histidine kinase [Paenibacillus paeoniae]|nr:sensor histidine kinase [Paenibacillus paeoniae]